MLTHGNILFGPRGPIFSMRIPKGSAKPRVAKIVRRDVADRHADCISDGGAFERTVMEFRWIAMLTLWTMLVGPMVDAPLGQPKARSQPAKMQRAR